MFRRSSSLLNDINLLRVKKGRKYLEVGFKGNDETYMLSSEFLRVYTTSAEALGHSDAERVIVSGKKHVTIEKLSPVGKYAVQIEFSDGHSSGIYRFQQIKTMTVKKYLMMREYILDLRKSNKKRDVRRTDVPSIMDKVQEKTRLKKQVQAASA